MCERQETKRDLNQESQRQEAGVCCPEFDTTLWDEKTIVWENKLFIKDYVPQVFHLPLPGFVNRVMQRMWNKAFAGNATPENGEFLLLAYDPSPWKSEYYLAVTKEVPETENVTISGTFLTKVFDGSYNNVPKWLKEMDEYVQVRGKKTKKEYLFYTTCPKCAAKYGHNYVVVFAEIE